DKVQGVHVQDVETLVVRRQRKFATTDVDDVRIMLRRGDVRLREVAVAELGEGRCTDPEVNNMALRLAKQQPHHHLLHVLEQNFIGPLDVHGALYGRRSKMQATDVAVLEYRYVAHEVTIPLAVCDEDLEGVIDIAGATPTNPGG